MKAEPKGAAKKEATPKAKKKIRVTGKPAARKEEGVKAEPAARPAAKAATKPKKKRDPFEDLWD